MAPKRQLQDPPPPAPGSSSTEDDLEESDDDVDVSPHKPNGVSHTVEYEDEKSEDDEEDEEEDEDDDRAAPVPSSKASQRHSSSDSGDGSTDESDTESDKTQPSPSVSDFTIKPSKPIADSAKPQKVAAKRTTSSQASASKRANESNAEGKEAKKKKVSNVPDEDVKKGSGIQRIWSDDDEMALLKGMVDFQSKKGVDPIAEVAAFHEYIKNNLQIEVSTVQLTNKIRTVKKKFQTNLKKGENGEDPVFNKPRDQKIFELSKKIWANAANTNGVDKKKPTQSKAKNSVAVLSPKLEMDLKKEEANGEMNAAQAKPCSNLSFLDGFLASGKLMFPESCVSIMKEAMPLIGSSKTKEFEQKWKKLQEDELVLYAKKVELIHETNKLLLGAMKSST